MKNKMINVLFAMLSVLLLIGCPQATNTNSENNSGTGGITRLSRPSITPVGGFYPEGSLEISISSRENAPIFYTTDGSTPNERDKKYTGPFNITIEKGKDVEITARAIQGSVQSSVASELYSDISSQITVENPIFSLSSIDGTAVSIDSSGEYSQDSLSVELSIPTEDAQIYYTINGGEPSQSDELYTTPINLDLTTNSYIIRAIGTKNKAKDSAIVEISVSKTGAPKAPVITTTIADYYDAATLARINPTLELEVQTDVTFTYSTDGETYSDSVPGIGIPSDGGSVTVYVRATKDGFDFTPTSSATFIINTTPLASPTINASDFYNANGDKQNASVTITGEEGATIFYSASAANPSTEYSAPLALAFPSEDTKDFTVKAIARRIGETESAVTEETITFEKRTLEAPVIVTSASDFFVNGNLVTQAVPVVITGPANAELTYRIGTTGDYSLYDATNKPTLAAEAGEKTISARATRDGYITGEVSSTFEVGALGNAPTPTIHNTASQFKSGDYAVEDVELNITIPAGSDANAVISYKIGDSGSYTPYDAANKPVIPFKVGTTKIYARVALHGYSTVDVQKDITIDSFGKLTAPNVTNTIDSFYTGTGSAGTRKSSVLINLSHKFFGKATIYYRIGTSGDYKVYTTTNKPVVAFENSPDPDDITVYTRIEFLGYESAEGSKTFTPRTLATPTLPVSNSAVVVLGQTITPSNTSDYGSGYSFNLTVDNTEHTTTGSRTLFYYKNSITSSSVPVTATVSKPGFTTSSAASITYVLPVYYYVKAGNNSSFGSNSNPFTSLQDAADFIKQINNKSSTYTIYVIGTVSGGASISLTNSDKLNINLIGTNEGTLTGPSNNSVLTVSGGNVTVETTNVTYKNGKSGITVTNGATVTMKNGIIQGNSGSGVSISSGTFNLNNGTIKENITSGKGGGVYVDSNCTFNLNAGTIENNKASEGGGIYYDGNSTVTVKSGTVMNNTKYNTDVPNNIQCEDHLNPISFTGSNYNNAQLGFTHGNKTYKWPLLRSKNNIFSDGAWRYYILSDQEDTFEYEYISNNNTYQVYYTP